MSRILRNKNESEGKIGREGTKSDVFIQLAAILAEKQNKTETKIELLGGGTKTKNETGTLICQIKEFR